MEYWATELAVFDGERPGLLLVDPHDFTSQCMSDLLCEHAAGWDVWASTSFTDGAPDRRPNLILLRHDGQVADNGELPELIAAASMLYPQVPIALLCSLSDLSDAFTTMQLGIRGYLSASLSAEQAIAALRLVMAGGVYVAPCATNVVAMQRSAAQVALQPPAETHETGEAERGEAETGEAGAPPPEASPDDDLSEPIAACAATDVWPLTPREEDVCFHLRQGKPNKVIAYELNVSENTVKVHVSRILRKLKVMNRTAVACMSDSSGPTAGQRLGQKIAQVPPSLRGEGARNSF